MANVAPQITQLLTPALGRFTAQRAVHLACERIGTRPEALAVDDVPSVCARLEPMLRTLVGRLLAEGLIDQIRALRG